MGLITWIALGLVAGLLARWLMPGPDPGGMVITILLGIGGALLGGFLMGILENLAGGYLDPLVGGGIKEVAPFLVLVAILMVRPYGLFGTREIERL